MCTSKAASHALIASITLASLAGCNGSSPMTPTSLAQSGAGSPSVQRPVFQNGRLNGFLPMNAGTVLNHPVQTPSFFRPDAKGKALIFLSLPDHNVVNIYLQSKHHKMVGQITGLNAPQGLATDKGGNLYVTNDTQMGTVPNILIYTPPYTKGAKLTLDDTGYPVSVAVSPSGIVAAVNYCSSPSCQAGTASITLYAKNSTQPCATIVDLTNFAYLSGATFDHKENLYVGGVGSGPNYTPDVGEIKGACQAKKITLLSTTNPLPYSAPLHIDKTGRIAIYDNAYGSNAQVIDAYNPPKKGSLGSPVTSTVLTSTYGYEFAFLASGRDLYFNCVISINSASGEYDYPAGGAPESSITISDPVPDGAAVSPPLIP